MNDIILNKSIHIKIVQINNSSSILNKIETFYKYFEMLWSALCCYTLKKCHD